MTLIRAYQQLETCSAPDGDLDLPACLSIRYHAIRDTLIRRGLSHRMPAVHPDMKCKCEIEEVDRKILALQADVVMPQAMKEELKT